jgi:hypothetical protein
MSYGDNSYSFTDYGMQMPSEFSSFYIPDQAWGPIYNASQTSAWQGPIFPEMFQGEPSAAWQSGFSGIEQFLRAPGGRADPNIPIDWSGPSTMGGIPQPPIMAPWLPYWNAYERSSVE